MTPLRMRLGYVGLCAATAVVLAACEGPTDTPVASSDLQNLQASYVVYGMTSYLTHDGIREGRVQADTAFMYNDSSDLSLRRMHVIFYDDAGRERAKVVADAGQLDQKTNRMVARGHVVLTIREGGRKVESPELVYDPDRDKIWSDSATVLTQGDGTVTRGSSFEADLEFKNVKIANPTGAIGQTVF